MVEDASRDKRLSLDSEQAGILTHHHQSAIVVPPEEVAHVGVRKVEATHKVYGKYSKWALFIG